MKATIRVKDDEIPRVLMANNMAELLWDWDQFMRQVYRGKIDTTDHKMPKLTMWQRVKMLFTGVVPYPHRDQICEQWFDMKYGMDLDQLYR
jgi:isocitrate dehydrogenase kinase/phosphatase